MRNNRAHFRGCLLGLAVGDALGAPLEWMEAPVIQRKHGRVTEMIGGGWLKVLPGQTTDDTQQTILLAESLLQNDAFAPDDIAERLVAWFDTNPPDIGNHTRAVLARIKGVGAKGNSAPGTQTTDWKTASLAVQRSSPSAAGNGSVMRCAPIALFDWQDTSTRIEHSRVQSEITHAHQECQWSCAIVTSFLAHAVTTGIRDAALDRALEECKDAPGHIRKRVTVATGKSRNELNPTGYVLDTVDCAIWALMNTYTFEEALVEAVNLGGDTDTIGAVCGALAGAFYGEADIPPRWLEKLHDRERIAGLADKLADRHGL
ncbi:MAG TPA: ADP-ribosylglycohydrolase family protein [Abditibacteriaceae bacterium]|jgi:ADP-ribosyl-[dinitrogen reductase] hydrolase